MDQHEPAALGKKLLEYIVQNVGSDMTQINLQDVLSMDKYSGKSHHDQVQLSITIQKSIKPYCKDLPSTISMLIAKYALSYLQPIAIGYMSPRLSVSLTSTNPAFKASEDNNEMTITHRSQQCFNLSSPCLLGEDYLPFNVSFILFVAGSVPFVGKHGGLYLGSIPNLNRWGAPGRVNIIDWIDKATDRGYHCYENVQQRDTPSIWNRKEWHTLDD